MMTEELKIDGLDTKAGLALVGTEETYKKILGIFYSSLEKKATLLEQTLAAGDRDAYTIAVHSLKSAAKQIGAETLSRQAARLETCCYQNDWDSIHAETPALLAAYRAYGPLLAPYCPVAEAVTEVFVPAAQIAAELTALYTALDDFDIDTAQHIFAGLLHCKLTATDTTLRARLGDAVAAMEYDTAIAIANEWRSKLVE